MPVAKNVLGQCSCLLGLLLSSAVSALDAPSPQSEDTSKPAIEWEEVTLTPAQKEAARRASLSPPGDPFKWSRSLTIPGPGDWEFLGGTPDGSEVSYGTQRKAIRAGAKATVWIRTEWRDPTSVRSAATWTQFDCSQNTMNTLHQMQYSAPDLGGPPDSLTDSSGPTPVLPGAAGERWLDWACDVTKPKAAPKAPATTQPPRK